LCHIVHMENNLAHKPPPRRRKAVSESVDLGSLLARVNREGVIELRPAEISASGLLDGFSAEEIHTYVIPRRTLARRMAKGEALARDEADRALRLARIWRETLRVFASRDKAHRWLRDPNPVFARRSPLEMLASEAGSWAVEELLGQIDHGLYI